MNKRIIIGLVILMGISLMGIVAVQVYWFNNSVAVRNELFDRSVNEAMNKAVRRMETGNDLKVIRGINLSDTVNWNKQIPFPPPPPPPPPPQDLENLDVVVKRDSLHRTITVMTMKGQHGGQLNYVMSGDSKSGKKSHSMKIITEDFVGKPNESDLKVQLSVNDSLIGKKINQLKNLSNRIQIEYTGWNS
jgi:two-component system phosphate regulon sensor histidine kinase PhoR